MMDIQNMASTLLSSFSSGSTDAFMSNGLLEDRHVPSTDSDLLSSVSGMQRQAEKVGAGFSRGVLEASVDIFQPTGLLGNRDSISGT